MRYWDTSGIVPLLVEEASSAGARDAHRADIEMATWWGTQVECMSALARRERDSTLDPSGLRDALDRLAQLSAGWLEVVRGEVLRRTAGRLLRVHPLRAADALQLAAAVSLADGEPAALSFVTLDDRLAMAAEREGFSVVTPMRRS